MTPEEIVDRVAELRAAYKQEVLTGRALTFQLYGLYVEVVRHIAAGDVDDPQELCRALVQAIAEQFPERPWASAGVS